MKSWAGAVAVIIMSFAAAAQAQSGNAGRGERVFNQQCKTCHSLEKDGSSLTGPTLHGLFGRKAGTAAGFAFSEAMTKSGIVWDEATLTEYCRDPDAKVPDTKMMVPGVKQAGQLADLVAYLKQATQ